MNALNGQQIAGTKVRVKKSEWSYLYSDAFTQS
jgi:hypothetical protein